MYRETRMGIIFAPEEGSDYSEGMHKEHTRLPIVFRTGDLHKRPSRGDRTERQRELAILKALIDQTDGFPLLIDRHAKLLCGLRPICGEAETEEGSLQDYGRQTEGKERKSHDPQDSLG